MIRRKEVKGLFLLLVSITVFFGLSSVGCKKESEKPGSTTFTNPADATTNSTFAKTIGGSSDDGAYSIIQNSDGGYVIAGRTRSFGAGYSDIYVVKLDSSGNVQWTKTIGGSSDDKAYSIIQSSDGGYVVAGRTRSFGAGWDIYVVKLDSSGNVQWTKTIGGSSDDKAYSIIQSSDGGYVVAGWTRSFGAGGRDFYVVKMDANGNVCFSKNITNYSVSSNVGSFSSASKVAISQSPRVKSISPTVSYGGSVSDVCASSPAPHFICSGSQDCGFGSAVATNKEEVFRDLTKSSQVRLHFYFTYGF